MRAALSSEAASLPWRAIHPKHPHASIVYPRQFKGLP